MSVWLPTVSLHSLVIVISVLAYILTTRAQREREVESVTRRREQAGTTRGQLITSQSNSVALAEQTGLADVHARALNNVLLPDGVSDLPTESVAPTQSM